MGLRRSLSATSHLLQTLKFFKSEHTGSKVVVLPRGLSENWLQGGHAALRVEKKGPHPEEELTKAILGQRAPGDPLDTDRHQR